MARRSFPPRVGAIVSWAYGHGFAHGVVMSTGVKPRSGREFAVVAWKSRSRTKQIERWLDEITWPGMPYSSRGDVPRDAETDPAYGIGER